MCTGISGCKGDGNKLEARKAFDDRVHERRALEKGIASGFES